MLHLLCGKIAAGKSTLSAELGARPGTRSSCHCPTKGFDIVIHRGAPVG